MWGGVARRPPRGGDRNTAISEIRRPLIHDRLSGYPFGLMRGAAPSAVRTTANSSSHRWWRFASEPREEESPYRPLVGSWWVAPLEARPGTHCSLLALRLADFVDSEIREIDPDVHAFARSGERDRDGSLGHDLDGSGLDHTRMG